MIKGGPKIIDDSLVLCLDTADIKCVAKAGCMGFTNAPQLLKNLVSTADTITSSSTVRLGNLTYYTIYGLTYPEGSQTPSNRDGITLGFNDTSSSFLLSFSRDMNYAVWDNATDSWVADSYFNGERIAGHCYDTYDTGGNAATEHVQFQKDYGAIVTAFPDATHIVVGSHAAENNDSDANTLAILKGLGGPSSWPTDRAEYVLIGKPGLGPDNAYVWQYQNNSSSVAHANVGLPILGRKGAGQNYLDFDGSNDYISCGSTAGNFGTDPFTVSMWLNFDALGPFYNKHAADQDQILFSHSGGKPYFVYNAPNGTDYGYTVSNTTISTGTWYNFVATVDRSSDYPVIYVNGVNDGSSLQSSVGSPTTANMDNNGDLIIGRGFYAGSYSYFNGKIAKLLLYKGKALTAAEVLQNYNATKNRFT